MPKAFDRMVEAIKDSLRKDHPKWDSKKIESRAYAIARTAWRKKYGKDPL